MVVEKKGLKFAILSQNASFRIYKICLDSLNKFKHVEPEFQCGGQDSHTNKLIDGAFSADCSKFFSISEDKKIKIWDLKNGTSFSDIPPQVLASYSLPEQYLNIEWIKLKDGDDIIAMVGEKDIDFFKISGKKFEKIETIENPHLGNMVQKMVNVNKGSQGPTKFITRCHVKVFTWNVDF